MIKLFKASALHAEYLRWWYAKHAAISGHNYAEQYSALMYDSGGDSWKYYLEQKGYQVVESVMNSKPLQMAWAQEHNYKPEFNDWMLDVLTAQIREFKPDVLFAQYYDVLSSEYVEYIKKEVPSIKVVVGWDGIALHNKEKFRAFDVMLTCLHETEEFYRKHGKITAYMPYGFDARWLDRIKIEKNALPVSFLGSIARIKGGHFARLQLLDTLLRHVDIHLWLTTHDPSWKTHIKLLIKMLLKKDWEGIQQTIREINRFNHVVSQSQTGLFGVEMMSKLASSAITINSHIDVAGKSAANIRLFEATGVGTCLLTDHKDNLSSFFEVGNEVLSYKSHEECIEYIRYYLVNPDKRDNIAQSGQKKTLSEHSMRQRLDIFDSIISKL